MPDRADTPATKAVITAAEPQLFVSDIKAACDFFIGKLPSSSPMASRHFTLRSRAMRRG